MKLIGAIIILVLIILLLRVGELYTQLSRYQRYWDRVNDQPIDKTELVYVAFGDSAAQGVGATRPEKGYVGLIANELSARTDNKVQIINLSKSGARIRDVLDTQLPRYQELDLGPKQIITIEVGANDIVNFDAKKFEADMDELMTKLPPHAVMSDLPSFKGSRLAKLEPKVVEANQIMDKLATKHGRQLARLHQRVEQNKGWRTFSADIFHPSNYGYKVNWLPAFMEQLDKVKTD